MASLDSCSIFGFLWVIYVLSFEVDRIDLSRFAKPSGIISGATLWLQTEICIALG